MARSAPAGRPPLIVPVLGKAYSGLYEIAETILRVVAGGALVTHGASKIIDPFGAAGMVEGIGFYPGALWSLLLSVTEFFGGIFLAIGFLTRIAALGGFCVLAVTVYFHWIVQDEGWFGAEKSVIWASIMLFFIIRGANRHTVDAKIGRQL
jgi:putative oxidoreductase